MIRIVTGRVVVFVFVSLMDVPVFIIPVVTGRDVVPVLMSHILLIN